MGDLIPMTPDGLRNVRSEPYANAEHLDAWTKAQNEAIAIWARRELANDWWRAQGAAQRGDTATVAQCAARRGRLRAEAIAQGVPL